MGVPGKKLPPLNVMAAFEAAARHLSFTRAAQELCLSQSAVSRQIQNLEARLGTALFERQHKDLVLTRAGIMFHDTVAQCLANIRQSVQNIENLSSSTVTISASAGMASFWLMAAVADFREHHPDINIHILANDDYLDPRREFIDFSIQYGDGNFPGLTTIKLFDEEVFPVCSTSYLARRGITQVRDLTEETLIDIYKPISPYGAWAGWVAKTMIGQPALHICMRLSSYELVYQAVCRGLGIGLGYAYIVPPEVRAGLLVRPMDVSVHSGMAEYLVFPSGKYLGSAACAMLDWLCACAKTSVWPARG